MKLVFHSSFQKVTIQWTRQQNQSTLESTYIWLNKYIQGHKQAHFEIPWHHHYESSSLQPEEMLRYLEISSKLLFVMQKI